MRRYLIITLFLSLALSQSEQSEDDEAVVITIDFDSQEELYLNFSINAYRGVPVYTAKTFDEYDQINPVYGLSIGTPFGFQAGFTYTTLDFEIMKYKFERKVTTVGNDDFFGGFAYQVGINYKKTLPNEHISRSGPFKELV